MSIITGIFPTPIPTDGKKKKGSESHEKKHHGNGFYISAGIAVLLLLLTAGYLANQSTTTQMDNSPISNDGSQSGSSSNTNSAVVGTPDLSQDKWKTEIIDIFGNKVPKENIIDVGNVPPFTFGEQPPHLVKEGIIDIQVEFKDGLKITRNKIPDTKQTLTFVRARIYDEKGLIKIKGRNDQFLEYTETVASTGQILSYDKYERPMIGNPVAMEVVIYFTKTPPSTPDKKIQI